MTDTLLTLATSYGLPFLALLAALSCLALPVPVSLVMIMSGSLVASGDLVFWQVFLCAFLAAVAADQVGYFIGRTAGAYVLGWLSKSPSRGALIEKAKVHVDERGALAVFLSRWLFSPLGPYVNFIGGAASMHWLKFTVPGALGEVLWVSLYVGLGYFFSDNISAVADLAGNASGFLAAGAVAAILGWRVVVVLRARPKLA